MRCRAWMELPTLRSTVLLPSYGKMLDKVHVGSVLQAAMPEVLRTAHGTCGCRGALATPSFAGCSDTRRGTRYYRDSLNNAVDSPASGVSKVDKRSISVYNSRAR